MSSLTKGIRDRVAALLEADAVYQATAGMQSTIPTLTPIRVAAGDVVVSVDVAAESEEMATLGGSGKQSLAVDLLIACTVAWPDQGGNRQAAVDALIDVAAATREALNRMRHDPQAPPLWYRLTFPGQTLYREDDGTTQRRALLTARFHTQYQRG